MSNPVPEGKVVVMVPKNSEPQSTVAMVWKGDFQWKDKYRMGFDDGSAGNKMQGTRKIRAECTV